MRATHGGPGGNTGPRHAAWHVTVSSCAGPHVPGTRVTWGSSVTRRTARRSSRSGESAGQRGTGQHRILFFWPQFAFSSFHHFSPVCFVKILIFILPSFVDWGKQRNHTPEKFLMNFSPKQGEILEYIT